MIASQGKRKAFGSEFIVRRKEICLFGNEEGEQFIVAVIASPFRFHLLDFSGEVRL